MEQDFNDTDNNNNNNDGSRKHTTLNDQYICEIVTKGVSHLVH